VEYKIPIMDEAFEWLEEEQQQKQLQGERE
jgi:hypothetical protein